MRSLTIAAGLLLAAVVCTAQAKVGMASRRFEIDTPYHWRDAKTRALIALVWYPADPGAVEQPQIIGPPTAPLFVVGKAAPGAKLATAPSRFPLIVLSHGTGGTAMIMGWFGAALASHGYMVVGVDHPGNNGNEDYTTKGFLLWWERAKDLSVVIDRMLADSEFGNRIDPKRIGAAGFSLGGYTMIGIAGGVTNVSRYKDFCASPAADGICKSPPEFPDLVEKFGQLDQLAKTDPEISDSIRHASDSYRDARVRAVFAMAPALGPAFTQEGLRKIAIPVEIVAGQSDQNVPIKSSAQYFGSHIPRSKVTILPGGVGHYVFLADCGAVGKKTRPELCTDAPDVDREAVHQKTVAMAADFFASVLK